ncbi:DUF6412 domain-containing protein [Streptomyces sp. NBC_00083]|uniref:DUF6412 domain-containing protein n=1 Tax=Streptomyces sp. NBC_00083 TaxID=2975647 RepID=UPI002251383F|nr:DUF6412 domain-containing protein [Streptomyces sp. NBC_00083]MCX5382235.1 DUF6412 domain-containing protein [Streptomyces sp. NBC_00083]
MSGVVARCARLTRPLLGPFLFLLAQVVLVEGGMLSAAVALAATAAAGSALAVCATLASRAVPHVARTRVRTAIRDRERRTAFLPQRDPDASGRPRPRAPGRLVPTAA